MGRIRSIKPEFNSNEGLSSVSASAHLLAEALLCYADDEGFFNANPALVRAGTCPLRKDFKNIKKLLNELVSIGYVEIGIHKEKQFGRIVNFANHQRISHPTPSKMSKLNILWKNSLEIPRKFPKSSGNPLENSGGQQEISGEPPEDFRQEQGTGNREQGTGGGIPEDLRNTAETPSALRAAFSTENDEAHMIATAVVDSIGTTTRWARDQLFEQAKFALKEHPGDFDGVRDSMIVAWKEYCDCAKREKLRAPPISPEKFFGEGRWMSSKLWGLKNGMRAYEGSNAA